MHSLGKKLILYDTKGLEHVDDRRVRGLRVEAPIEQEGIASRAPGVLNERVPSATCVHGAYELIVLTASLTPQTVIPTHFGVFKQARTTAE